MNWPIIQTLVAKDIILFFRDIFFGVMTIVALAMYIVFYLIMPKTVDETIKIGVYAPQVSSLLQETIEDEGVLICKLNSDNELKQAIKDNKYNIGISLPDDIQQSFYSGKLPRLMVYFSSELPDEMKEMYTIFMSEMINRLAGSSTELEVVEIILGPDMGGKQIPFRDRMLPLFLFVLLIMETFGLANLITIEVESETIQALLTTPMNIVDLFIGKGITGVSLAFLQAILLLILTNNFSQHFILLVVVLLLGSIMVTALSFFIASIAKDMMSVVAWGTLLFIILSIPAISILIPGAPSAWIQKIPSYFLVDILHKTINFNVGWNGNMNNILLLAGLNLLFVLLGILSLKRKLV